MGNVQSEEARLWNRCLNGEGEAFRVLYSRHRDRVFRHAYRLCEDRHEAEDIMATAFLELWRRRAKVRVVEGSMLPWLLVTTTNAARNRRRSALRYRRFLDALPRTDEADGAAQDPAGSAQQVLDQKVARALIALSAEDVHLVSLVVFDEYTIAAAAAVLNLTPGAAKTRMHRARQRMKNALTDEHPTATSTTPVMEGELS